MEPNGKENSKIHVSKKGESTASVILKCGVVMPISALDEYLESHWVDVKNIIFDVIGSAGFEVDLVSNGDEVGIIQRRIVQNLYDLPIVVCDVSGKNPNVMFELGLRLAFDKPTVIIKDDCTAYTFDTAPIEHLTYPKDLRYSKIQDFKLLLKEKIVSTVQASEKDPNYSTFLKHFGTFRPAELRSEEASLYEYFVKEMESLKQFIFSNTGRQFTAHESSAPSEFNVRQTLIDIIDVGFSTLSVQQQLDAARGEIDPIFYNMVISRALSRLSGRSLARLNSPLEALVEREIVRFAAQQKVVAELKEKIN